MAIVGLQQLSSRLQSAGGAFNGVHEGVTFLRDFETFRASLPAIRARRPTGVPPAPPTLLSVSKLTYRYPGSTMDAVHDVSLELRRGQVMAIVGANGSGKTTLSKLLCQLLQPRNGSVSWDGVDLAGCDPSLVRAQIAPVFQDFARYYLTVRQTIGLGDVGRLGDVDAIRTCCGSGGDGAGHRQPAQRTRDSARQSVFRWCRSLDRPVATSGDRSSAVPRCGGGHSRRTFGIARPPRGGRALRTLAPALSATGS